jgi:formate dehydrogenase subunit gamma
MSEQKNYFRFSIAQRIEHWAEMLSFTGLTLTGIPQKFAGNGWAESLIGWMGGIEMVRNLHHISATIMAVAVAYHIVAVCYKVFVLRVRWTMFPRINDALDALDVIRYNLGLTREHPKLDRFNFGEKFEYWAFVWGAMLMGATGFIMWNPINAMRFMAGDAIPAAKAAHGAEAILAALAILIWHFYNVHIKMFNKAMFTGAMTEDQMEEEHGYELQRIAEGRADKRPDPETIKRRERVFIPIALVASVLMLVTIYFFVTYEETALTTVPKQSQKVQIYAPVTPTVIPRPGQASSSASGATAAPKALPVSHDGRTSCNTCHTNNIGPKNPADHAGRSDSTCTACHKFSGSAPASSAASSAAPATTGGPKPLPATHDGRTTCNTCHENNIGPKNPADHAGRTDATCTACHKSAGSSAPAPSAPAATKAPGATAVPTKAGTTSSASSSAAVSSASSSAAASGPKAQPANHAGRTVCLACHQALPQPAFPADHAGRAEATCAVCHKAP